MKMICVPLSPEAMLLMDTDTCPNSLLKTINLTPREYKELLESKAIDTINITLGKLIDEYEDEKIDTFKDLKKALNILHTIKTTTNSTIIEKLIKLNTLAIKNHTGLFFFF
ncbi:hypothetical protein [Pseudomonas sp. BIGb0164]|uniref:hypothetical protein n=1 Tax=Pseudomonas sp. BIGb0164 TaxID=2940605 RepID=UPI0021676E75|nr:hypothetical protein [Pseudomonas sp. BIGb0164]MCS4251444.1 hypothetical protein [Pseudomonas sp. BIGb0164]